MKYPHIVVKNGVWYPAGTEVPEDAPWLMLTQLSEQLTAGWIPLVKVRSLVPPSESKTSSDGLETRVTKVCSAGSFSPHATIRQAAMVIINRFIDFISYTDQLKTSAGTSLQTLPISSASKPTVALPRSGTLKERNILS